MGLDMYLKATKHFSGEDYKKEERDVFEKIVGLAGIVPSEQSKNAAVSVTIGYWRKANAIHAWFVRNVQNGTDDCGTYEVSRKQLEKLRESCSLVLSSVECVNDKVAAGEMTSSGVTTKLTKTGEQITNPNMVASKILPTQEGFFFGKTDYDSDYLQDLRDTIEIVNRAISMEGWCSFQYRASW